MDFLGYSNLILPVSKTKNIRKVFSVPNTLSNQRVFVGINEWHYQVHGRFSHSAEFTFEGVASGEKFDDSGRIFDGMPVTANVEVFDDYDPHDTSQDSTVLSVEIPENEDAAYINLEFKVSSDTFAELFRVFSAAFSTRTFPLILDLRTMGTRNLRPSGSFEWVPMGDLEIGVATFRFRMVARWVSLHRSLWQRLRNFLGGSA